MKNILVATDFSSNAYNALFHATRLLGNAQGNFHLLNVYDKNTVLSDLKSGVTATRALADESVYGLHETYHRIKRDRPDCNCNFETLSVQGDLVETIKKTVQEKHIDLIVMGNSGCSEIEAIFLGSNVLRAIGGIKKCPILTIPKEIDFTPPKVIAFVTDYKGHFDVELLEPLRFIARQFNSKIRIMHINEEETFTEIQHRNRGLLLDFFSDFDHTLNWVPLFKSKATAIHHFLEALSIDMLAMVNYEHSFLEKIGREPLIKRMAFDLDIPFLVIPYQD